MYFGRRVTHGEGCIGDGRRRFRPEGSQRRQMVGLDDRFRGLGRLAAQGFCKAQGVSLKTIQSWRRRQARPHRRGRRRQTRGLCQNRGGHRDGLGCRSFARQWWRAPSAAVLMLGGWPADGMWLSTERTDMCRSFDGLCMLVSTRLGENPGVAAGSSLSIGANENALIYDGQGDRT